MMRVLVERGSITNGLLAQALRSIPDTEMEVLVLERDDLELQLRQEDVVISRAIDLVTLGARTQPVALYGELAVTAFCATWKEDLIQGLRRTEIAVLYQLALARGRNVQRSDLHERCWKSSKRPKARTVDVAVHRLRRKIEATGLRIFSERSLGYKLALPPVAPKKRVLVVEDEALMQSSYQRLFRSFDIEVDFANTTALGKTLAASRDYAAYFIDLMMPGGSGASVIPVIQKRSPLAPIMIVTACADDEAIELSSKYGVAYAEKPCKPSDLQRFVKRTVLNDTT